MFDTSQRGDVSRGCRKIYSAVKRVKTIFASKICNRSKILFQLSNIMKHSVIITNYQSVTTVVQ